MKQLCDIDQTEHQGHASLITPIEGYTLIIDYFEDSDSRARTVEQIRIFRD